MLHVDPVPHPLRELGPLIDVLEHALAAEAVELLDSELLHVRLTRQLEPLLDLDLHRQSVGVPTALPLDQVSLHRLVAGKQVFHRPGQDMMDTGEAVGRRRSLVEDEGRRLSAQLDALLEDPALPPEAEDGLFQLGEFDLARDFLERH